VIAKAKYNTQNPTQNNLNSSFEYPGSTIKMDFMD